MGSTSSEKKKKSAKDIKKQLSMRMQNFLKRKPKAPKADADETKEDEEDAAAEGRPSQRQAKPPQKPHLRRRKRLRPKARKRKPRERRRKRRPQPRQRTSQPQQRPPQQPSRVKVRRQQTPLPQNNKQFWTQVFIIDNNYNNLYYIEKNNNHP